MITDPRTALPTHSLLTLALALALAERRPPFLNPRPGLCGKNNKWSPTGISSTERLPPPSGATLTPPLLDNLFRPGQSLPGAQLLASQRQGLCSATPATLHFQGPCNARCLALDPSSNLLCPWPPQQWPHLIFKENRKNGSEALGVLLHSPCVPLAPLFSFHGKSLETSLQLPLHHLFWPQLSTAVPRDLQEQSQNACRLPRVSAEVTTVSSSLVLQGPTTFSGTSSSPGFLLTSVASLNPDYS